MAARSGRVHRKDGVGSIPTVITQTRRLFFYHNRFEQSRGNTSTAVTSHTYTRNTYTSQYTYSTLANSRTWSDTTAPQQPTKEQPTALRSSVHCGAGLSSRSH